MGKELQKIPERGNIITFEAPSKKSYTLSEIDQSNPVAKYEYTPKSILGKFTYYVLEVGKDSYIKKSNCTTRRTRSNKRGKSIYKWRAITRRLFTKWHCDRCYRSRI